MFRSDLSAEQLRSLEQQALGVMSALSRLALGHFSENYNPEVKADKSLVTLADRAIEKKARELLAPLTPDWGFVGEELGTLSCLGDSKRASQVQASSHSVGLTPSEMQLMHRPDSPLNLDTDTYWILDPIDGTLNFLSRAPLWSVLLALIHKGRPVLGVVALPALDEVFFAAQGCGARWGKLSHAGILDRESEKWFACATRKTSSLSEAFSSYSSPKPFASRGIESFLNVLHEKSFECRTHSDAYGYTRILCGGIDLMVDPLVAPYDVAALQVLFDETPDACLTTLQGQTGPSRFRMGSVVAGANQAMTDQLLQTYREHLLETADEFCEHAEELNTEPLSPESFSPTFALPFESGPSRHPAKIWVRSVETAVAQFLSQHSDASVEDVAVLLGTREAAARALSNGNDEGPPEVAATTSFHVRAVVSGGIGLMTGTLQPAITPLTSVRAALESAWKTSESTSGTSGEKPLLAAREQLIAHCGQHPWRSVRFASSFQSASEIIQSLHREPRDERIHSVKTRLNMSVEYRWQYFLDAAQQTFVTQVCRISTNATSQEESEKRTAFARYLQNHLPAEARLKEDMHHHFEKVKQQSLDLLAATLVPEDPEYDYLAVDADLLGLILHEAIGHAAEGDLIQTGASGFGEQGVMKELEVGPEWMDILIDGTLDNCGYLPVDAEGVLPRRKHLVRKGRLVDSIHTRQTARVAGKTPDGCARLQSLQHPSLNRMTSIWVVPETSKALDVPASAFYWDDLPPAVIQSALEKQGYLDGSKGVLLLSGWKGGTASCSNLEFRADVARVLLLKRGQPPKLMREANFTGIATECFRSAVDAFGPTLCRSIGTCGKDGQGVLTSDGGPAFMVFVPHSKVRVIGTGDDVEGDE
ncbi:MAG: Histidinol-phosphatase [Pseudomonadota bacterium]|jgi:predicted Zn-dependent protease/fructose-1,6-bisphosphatase/inositol monophosphatase family enzyme